MKVCKKCQKEFSGIGKSGNRKYCDECLKIYKEQQKEQKGEKVKICEKCNKEFLPYNPKVRYCKDCKSLYMTSMGNFENIGNLNPGVKGAIQELRVSVDLLKKGFEVFRVLSPICSCDVLVKKENKIFSVEVKSGNNGYSPCGREKIKADCFAVVFRDKIVYEPDVENIVKNG